MCKDVDKIDLNSPESLLTQLNLKSLLNLQTFQTLPLYYQYKLAKLLPQCDQQTLPNGWLTVAPTALNNEFFNRAQQLWVTRLKDNKLTPEYALKRKLDQEKERLKLDPWKLKHFEPVWGASQLTGDVDASDTISDASANIIDTMYKQKVPTAKKTGQKQFIPSARFHTSTGVVQLATVGNSGSIVPQSTSGKESGSSKRRKSAVHSDDKASTRVYLVSNVGKMQPITSGAGARAANYSGKDSHLSRKLDFETGSSVVGSDDVGFVPLTSPSKNFHVQVVKNPQLSKYRISSNESASNSRRSHKETNLIVCNCSHKAMKLCLICKCFCHFDCVDANGQCPTCASAC
jgi:hypothetical protein